MRQADLHIRIDNMLKEQPDFGYSKFNDRDLDIEKLTWESWGYLEKGLRVAAFTEPPFNVHEDFAKENIVARLSAYPYSENQIASVRVASSQIKEDWIGTGVGQMLYNTAIEKARKIGYEYFYSDYSLSAKAIKAWQKLSTRYKVENGTPKNEWRYRIKLYDVKTTEANMNESKYSSPIQFHNELNPKLWHNKQIRPEVKEHLLTMADVFVNELQMTDLDIYDVEISGSNAAFSYSRYSDIDLHVVVDIPVDKQDFYRNYFDAKKNLFNDEHDLKIRGIDVELYVQFKDQPFISNGIYSLVHNKWISEPVKQKVKFNDRAVRSKTHYFSIAIADVIRNKKCDKATKLWLKIKECRKNGLTETGEFGAKNLVYKLLRNAGLLQKLYNFRIECQDKELNLEHTEL